MQPSLELKTVMTFLAARFRIERFGRFVCLLFALFKRGIEYCRGLSKNEKEKLDNSVWRCYHNKAFRKRASGGIGRLARFRF